MNNIITVLYSECEIIDSKNHTIISHKIDYTTFSQPKSSINKIQLKI